MSDGFARRIALSGAFEWTSAPNIARIIAALENKAAGSARFVGGCVRDSLIGATPHDIDIATTLEPEAVVAALHDAGLGAAPTGLAHGTVTAIAGGGGVEITTLRADVSTDGRRASVAFTSDWRTDALRRDFTINALYLAPDGALFDYASGEADLHQGRVRFIGDSGARIREDYLRILRFFRFSARFAREWDEEGLGACARERDGIDILSSERIGAEFSTLLGLPRAAEAVSKMAETGVLAKIWPAAPSFARLGALKARRPDAVAPLALAALWGPNQSGLGARLRLSKADSARAARAAEAAGRVAALADARAARALLYELGAEGFADAAAIAACDGAALAHGDLAAQWTAPIFPVRGRDLIAAGVPAGPAVASALASIEARWVAEDFPSTERLKQLTAEEAARATSKC